MARTAAAREAEHSREPARRPPERPRVRTLPSTQLSTEGAGPHRRTVAAEVPVALTFNGISHVVMMTTPADFEDFAVGFALGEGIVEDVAEIEAIEARDTEAGILIDIRIPPERVEALIDRRRNLVGQSGCGLCGMEDLEDAIRPLPPLEACPALGYPAAHRALEALRAWQPLNAECGAVHAAAFADWSGEILAAREDVGRHNALDKLVGHIARAGLDPAGGFALLSSRCSYELVHKAIAARIPALVTVSAPTTLAIELARGAGLTLIALARSDSMLCFNDPHGLFAAGRGGQG